MKIALGAGFMARLARKALFDIGIKIEATNDPSAQAA